MLFLSRLWLTIKYYLNNNKILGEDRISNDETVGKLRYFYDKDGLCGFTYNGETYNYLRDILGSIVAIYKNSRYDQRAIVCKYQYDAFGDCIVYDSLGAINTESTFIGNINPFRWKSHYFDTESIYL